MRARRVLKITAVIAWLVILAPGAGAAEDDVLQEQLEELEPAPLAEFMEDLRRELDEDLPVMDLPSVVQRLRTGEAVLSVGKVLRIVLGQLASQVLVHISLMGQLLVLALLSALLTQVERAWEKETVSVVARGVIYLALTAVAMVTFREAFSVAQQTISRLGDVMLALLPTMVTLLAGSGAFISAAIFHPLVVFICHLVAHMVRFWIFPLIFAGVVLSVAGQMTPEHSFARLAEFVRKVALWMLEGAMIIFLGVMTVQGAAGAVADGVALRSIKFGAKAMIPVLGGVFSDAGEVVMTSSLLLKNAAGLAGLGVVALIAVLPLVQLVAMTLTYRLAAALAAPLGGTEISDLLETLGDGLVLISVAVGAVAVMFYLTLTIMLVASNATVMLR